MPFSTTYHVRPPYYRYTPTARLKLIRGDPLIAKGPNTQPVRKEPAGFAQARISPHLQAGRSLLLPQRPAKFARPSLQGPALAKGRNNQTETSPADVLRTPVLTGGDAPG
jgi:hypothetical protein